MRHTLKLLICIYFANFSLVKTLQCYDCNGEDCFSVTETTSRIVCPTSEAACFSFKNDKEGKAYRGCYITQIEENVCETLKSSFLDGFSKCDYCFDDFCNDKNIRVKDTDFYCYSCNFILHGEACKVPQGSNLEPIECDYVPNAIPVCYSYDSNQGVERGCFPTSQDIKDPCDYLTEDVKYRTIKNCEICRENKCNSKIIGSDSDQKTGNSNKISINPTLIIFSLILLICKEK